VLVEIDRVTVVTFLCTAYNKGMIDKLNNVTADSLFNATGKNWDEWIEIIDDEGGENQTHKEIAKMLEEKGYIANQWWCQMVTVGYEYAKGRRELGETVDSGYEMGVRRTLPLPSKRLWDFMLSTEGLALWLGTLEEFPLEKGATVVTKEGTKIEMRSVDEGKKLRFKWQP
jgi:hypothetical protein